MNEELKAFLFRNNIDDKTWETSGCDWATLAAIGADHYEQSQMLSESAALYAKLIQSIPGVHSVRWRVKDTDHLLEKIIRKRAEAQEKYKNIGVENYYEIVTDLIGIRALHLFKDDCFEINRRIASIWSPVEKPIAYIRKGDPEDLVEKYKSHDLEVKTHRAGYRSVHHVISSQPINRKVYAEIQVRTIFEEGWSEIDHKIRYPNFSNNELVNYFLTIFNRMAGSADEMGSFVTGLAASIQDYQLQISKTSKERDENLKSMEELISQLTALKQQDKSSKETITKLQQQVAKMRQENSIDRMLPSASSASDLYKMLHTDDAATTILRDVQSTRSAILELEKHSATSDLTKFIWPYDLTKK
jgi:putative GTP pyrophosphokinase